MGKSALQSSEHKAQSTITRETKDLNPKSQEEEEHVRRGGPNLLASHSSGSQEEVELGTFRTRAIHPSITVFHALRLKSLPLPAPRQTPK
jgi:hypothetical protein